MCISGSESSSTISLSSSISPPLTTSSISLPASRAIRRTSRVSLSNTCPSGTIRTSRSPCWSSSSLRSSWRPSRNSSCAQSFEIASTPPCRALSASRCTFAFTRSSSPTVFISASSRPMSTRTVWVSERSETSGATRSARAVGSRCGSGSLVGAAPLRLPFPFFFSAIREELGGEPGEQPVQGLGRGRGADDQVEGDRVRVSRLGRGQRADQLAVALQPRVQLGELLVEVGEVEHRAHPVERHLLAHVLAQPVLLVLGEHLPHLGVELEPVERVAAPRAARSPRRDRSAARPGRGPAR